MKGILSDVKPVGGPGIKPPQRPSQVLSNQQAFADMDQQMMSDIPSPAQVHVNQAAHKVAQQAKPVQVSAPNVPVPALPVQKPLDMSIPRGLENMTPETIANAEWRIIQNTSEIVATHPGTQGKLYNTADGTIVDSIELIFVGFRAVRRLFNREDRSSAALCYSEDGEANSGGKLFKPGEQKCALCPYAQWGQGNDQAECTKMFRYTVLMPSQFTSSLPFPMTISFSKTALPVAASFNRTLWEMRQDVFAYSYRISTKLIQKPKGSAYVPVFTCERETTEEERAICQNVHERLRTLQFKAYEQE